MVYQNTPSTELQEGVYVEQPPSFVLKGHEHHVLRLVKALYGLRQAPRAWYAKLDESLVKLSFTRISFEHASSGAIHLIVGVYVDNLLITGENQQDIDKFKVEMHSFKMSDLGLLHYYLRLEVKQMEERITICQSAYAAKILEVADLITHKPSYTLMESRLKLSKLSSTPTIEATFYRSIIGSLQYLVNSRLDLAFFVGYLSHFMENLTTEYLPVVKRVLRYVAGTLSFGCFYKRKKDAQLTGYNDSNLAGDIDAHKSTTGVLFFLGNNSHLAV